MLRIKPFDVSKYLKRVLSLVLCLAMIGSMMTFLAPEAEASNYTGGVANQYYYYAGYSSLDAARRSTWSGVSYSNVNNAMRLTISSGTDHRAFFGSGDTEYSAKTYPYLMLVFSSGTTHNANQEYVSPTKSTVNINNLHGTMQGTVNYSMESGKLYYMLYNIGSLTTGTVGGFLYQFMHGHSSGYIDLYGFAFLNGTGQVNNAIKGILSQYSGIYKFQIKVNNTNPSWTKVQKLHYVPPYNVNSSQNSYPQSSANDDYVYSTTEFTIVNTNQIIGWTYMAIVQYYKREGYTFAGSWEAGDSSTYIDTDVSHNYISPYNDQSGADSTSQYMKTSFFAGCIKPFTTAVYNLKPKWNTNSYTVTLNKGTGVASVSGGGSKTYGSSVSVSATMSTGYVFNGWTGTYSSSSNPYSFTMPAGNVSLTANAKLQTYTVSYNANGGSGAPSAQTKTYGTNLTLSSTKPTRTGYTFQGWGTSASDTSVDYAAGATYSSNAAITLYAIWKINTWTVSYNANGGSGAPSAQTKTYGTNLTLSSTKPTRTGYTFQGWGTSASDTSVDYAAGATYSSNAAITLYAIWKINQYTVTFDANGGSVSPTTQKANYGAAVSFPTPSRTGYTFNGWYTAASGGTKVTSATIPANDTTKYYAQWTIKQYTVTFDPNGGSVSPTTQKANYGTAVSFPTPTRTGYTFNGWYTAASGGTKVTSATIPANDTTKYYAQWTVKTYNVYLNYNYDGSTGPDLLKSDDGKLITYSSTNFRNVTKPTRAGYTFLGYYTQPSGGVQVWDANGLAVKGDYWHANYADASKWIYDSATDLTFYAQWTANSYTVTFNANTGNVSTASKSVTYDSTYGDLPVPTKTGYNFEGWFTEASGGTKVTADTKVTITAAQTLYAQWKINQYTVKFSNTNENKGTLSGTSYKANYDADVEFPTTTPKAGYSFSGWYTASSGGSVLTSAKIPANNDTTYYARWSINSYDIAYDLGGGKVDAANPTTYNVETETFTLNNPTRVGYDFTGWTGSNGSTPQKTVTIAKGSTGDKTYTANWTKVQYTIGYTLNGGSVDGTNPTSYSIESDAITLINPTKNGYTFKGWTGSNGSTPQKTVTIAKGSTGNKSYTANWALITYDIVYNLNGGTNPNDAPTTFTYESADITLPTPTRQNYKFMGWYKESNFSGNVHTKISQHSYGTKTYYAKWELDAVKVTFDANGGSVGSASKDVVINSQYGELPTATRTGYTFLGWFDAAAGGTEVTATTTMDKTVAHTLYAHWEAIEYTLTVNMQWGYTDDENHNGVINPDNSDQMIFTGHYGETIYVPTFKKNGYYHYKYDNINHVSDESRWSDDYNYYTFTNKSENVTVTFYPYEYTITFMKSDLTSSSTQKYHTNLDPNDPDYNPNDVNKFHPYGWEDGAGHWIVTETDGNWKVGELFLRQSIYTIEYGLYGNVTLRGCGIVNFDTNADDATCSTASRPVFANCPYGEVYGDLPVPTRPDYDFEGWYTAKTGGTPVTAETIATLKLNGLESTVTLYAHWTPSKVTVTLDPNGGNVTPTSVGIPLNSVYGELPTATRTGYTFLGWFDAAEGGTEVTATTVMDKTVAHTLYAHWEEHTYTVVLHKNDNTDETDTWGPYTYTEEITFVRNEPFSRMGYKHIGWSYTADATSGNCNITFEKDTDGTYRATASELTADNGGVVHLYAVWELYTYTLTFDADGGTINTTGTNIEDNGNGIYTLEYTIEDTFNFPLATKNGYSMKWKDTTDYAGGKVTSGYWYNRWLDANKNSSTVVDIFYDAGKLIEGGKSYRGDAIFTAEWEAIEYTITVYPENQNSLVFVNGYEYTPYTFTGTIGETITINYSDVSIPHYYGRCAYISGNNNDGSKGSINAVNLQPSFTYTFGYSDTTIIVQYNAVRYNITYKLGGGSVWVTDTYDITGKTWWNGTGDPYTIFRGSASYDRWQVESFAGNWDVGDQYAFNGVIGSGKYGDVTLIQSYINYTITLDAKVAGAIDTAGTNFKDNGNGIYTLKYTKADTVVFPVATRSGYTLNRWVLTSYDDELGSQKNWGTVNETRIKPGNSVSNKMGSVTLTAEWIFTVVYDANGAKDANGEQVTVFKSETYVEGATTLKMPSSDGLNRDRVQLLGWSTDPNWKEGSSANLYTAGTLIPGIKISVTFYAIWGYTVNFNDSIDTTNTYKSVIVTFPAGVSKTPVVFPDVEHGTYKLYGWSTRPANLGKSFTVGDTYEFFADRRKAWEKTVAEDASNGCYVESTNTITLYTCWSKEYTVKLDPNGGQLDNVPSSIVGVNLIGNKELMVVIPSDVPSRDLYGFVGWGWYQDSKTKAFTAGQSYSPTKFIEDNIFTLYAVWSRHDDIRCYDPNDGYGTYINTCRGYFGDMITLTDHSGVTEKSVPSNSAFYSNGCYKLGVTAGSYVYDNIADYRLSDATKVVIVYKTTNVSSVALSIDEYSDVTAPSATLNTDGAVHYAVIDLACYYSNGRNLNKFKLSFGSAGDIEIYAIGTCANQNQADFFGRRAVSDWILSENNYTYKFNYEFRDAYGFDPSYYSDNAGLNEITTLTLNAQITRQELYEWHKGEPLRVATTLYWDDIDPVRTGYGFEGWRITSPDGGFYEIGSHPNSMGTGLDFITGVLGTSPEILDPTLQLWSTGDITNSVIYKYVITGQWRALFGSLTIERPDGLDEKQDFIFTISGKETNNDHIKVTVVSHDFNNADGVTNTVVVDNLPVGNYAISEWDNWSWRYSEADVKDENNPGVQSITEFNLTPDGKTLTYAVSGREPLWLSGAYYASYKDDED